MIDEESLKNIFKGIQLQYEWGGDEDEEGELTHGELDLPGIMNEILQWHKQERVKWARALVPKLESEDSEKGICSFCQYQMLEAIEESK